MIISIGIFPGWSTNLLMNLMTEMQYGFMVTLDLARKVDPAWQKQALLGKAAPE